MKAREDALARFDSLSIISTDKGIQFTPWAWTGSVMAGGMKTAMDGKGRFRDNIFVKRLDTH